MLHNTASIIALCGTAEQSMCGVKHMSPANTAILMVSLISHDRYSAWRLDSIALRCHEHPGLAHQTKHCRHQCVMAQTSSALYHGAGDVH